MKFKICLLILFSLPLRAVPFSIPSKLQIPSQHIVSSILNCEFNEAFRLSDSLHKELPDDPLPSLLKLASIGMRDIDFDRTLDSAEFLNTYQKTIDLIKLFETADGISSYSLTLEGLCKAIHAAFYLRIKSYGSALQNGFDALRLLKDAKELDPTNTEVDLFLGLYDYGRAELRSRLWWVFFWSPGNKKEGIHKLEDCSKSAFLTGTAAQLSLSDIYTKEGKPELSLPVIERLEKKYPQSRFVLWAKAKYFEQIEKYNDAALAFEKLSLSYAQFPEGEYNSLVTKNQLAHMLSLAGEKEQADEVCRAILDEKLIKQNKDIKRDTEKLLERR